MFIATWQAVRSMLAAERPWEHVEAYIEDQRQLGDEERSLLWLLAWMGGEPSALAAELGRGVVVVA